MKTERLLLIPEPFLSCDIHIDASGEVTVLNKDGGIRLTITRAGEPHLLYLPDEEVDRDIARPGHDPRADFLVVEE